jgi:VWFA-related protein
MTGLLRGSCSILGILLLAGFGAAAPAADDSPAEADIARAVERGTAFLRHAQGADGAWNFTYMHQHRLGMTALAGLALLENGVAADDPAILGARRAVEGLSVRSDQTYDLALAILFLTRQGSTRKGAGDELLPLLASRLAAGDHGGSWTYIVPMNDDRPSRGSNWEPRALRRAIAGRSRESALGSVGDNSNTQFALLGLWAAGRNVFDADQALESIDGHFRSTQLGDGGWGYRQGMPGSHSMSCAGLMGLAMAAARPSLAERQTARARGAALAADPAFQAALQAVARDARQIDENSDIYYLWSLERVCVALGLRLLDGFDWYARGARILLDQQQSDGSWPNGRWGVYPSTCLSLLFLRKANLAFELDRVLRLPGPTVALATAVQEIPQPPEPGDVDTPTEAETADPDGPAPGSGSKENTVVVTGASQQEFPRIAVQFEVRRPDGTFLVDATRDDFRVTEEGKEVQVLDFQAPQAREAIPTTIVLVVDRSLSMEEEDRMGSLKEAVSSFLEKLPEGSRVAVVAFGSEVVRICPYTTDRERVRTAVNRLRPGGATRFYDAVAEALELLDRETGRRAVLALTDGEDTFSQAANLDSTIASARKLGLPVYTLGLGTEEEIESADLRRMASSTRGQYYPARRSDQLRSIYETIAARIGASYTLVYQSDRRLPDGTLRPVQLFYRGSRQAAETTVFIPGMVVPAAGWSTLFLFLIALLTALALLPTWLNRRTAGPPPPGKA